MAWGGGGSRDKKSLWREIDGAGKACEAAGGFHHGWEGKCEIKEESQVLASDPFHLLRWAVPGQEQLWGAGGDERVSSGTSQGAESRLAVRAPQGKLRAECGQAHLGIRRRGPGCALGGKAGGEGQDMGAPWSVIEGGPGCLSSGDGARAAWRMWRPWPAQEWEGRPGGCGRGGYFQVLGPSVRAKGVVGSGGRAFPSPPLPFLSPLLPPSFPSLFCLVALLVIMNESCSVRYLGGKIGKVWQQFAGEGTGSCPLSLPGPQIGNAFSLETGRKLAEPTSQKEHLQGFATAAQLGFPCKRVCDGNEGSGGFFQGREDPGQVHRASGAVLSINKTVPALWTLQSTSKSLLPKE